MTEMDQTMIIAEISIFEREEQSFHAKNSIEVLEEHKNRWDEKSFR